VLPDQRPPVKMEEYDMENREPIEKYLDGFQVRHRIHKAEVDAVNCFTVPTDATVLKWDEGTGIVYYSIPSYGRDE